MTTRIILLVCVLLAPASLAHSSEEHLIVRAFDDDGYYFKITGYTESNPDIVLIPGAVYNITLINKGTEIHDFRFTANSNDSPKVTPGGVETFSLQVPAQGVGSYWDTSFQKNGMKGKAYPSLDEMQNAPSLSVFVSLAALAAVAVITKSRKI